MDFAYGVERVRASMDGVDGLVSHQSFRIQWSLADPIMVTFWRDDAAMRAFAYRPGEQKFRFDGFRRLETADRSSFTRLVALDRRGTSHGGDPPHLAVVGSPKVAPTGSTGSTGPTGPTGPTGSTAAIR
jgi:hypothetical protein